MRKIWTCWLLAGLVTVVGCGGSRSKKESGAFEGRITISGAWALYPMAVKWSEEYRKLHPGVTIDISAGGAGKGMADALSGVVDLGMVSRDISAEEKAKGAWWVSVVKDAVVPTVNVNHPGLDELLKRGMKQAELRDAWVTGGLADWGTVLPALRGSPVHVYTRSDACGAAQTWAQYLKSTQEELKGVGVYGDPGLAEAVRNDKLGIGYNNIGFAYDKKTGRPVAGITILPLDVNTNGVVDANEQFYGTLPEVTAAVADGRYPSPPARELHFVARSAPAKPVVAEFIRWVLTDGQKHVMDAGYVNLTSGRIDEEKAKLAKIPSR